MVNVIELNFLKQILQLVPRTQPGHFYAWVIADGTMHKVPINVPRVFYLNSKAPITEEFPGRRVKKILPHSRPNFNLIEVSLDLFLKSSLSLYLIINYN